MASLPQSYTLSPEVAGAIQRGAPLVALESTVIAHGLPPPHNLALAQDMETEVRQRGALPATIAVLDGKICVGVDAAGLERLASAPDLQKISVRDLGPALAQGVSGGTTVAATIFAAHQVGLRVMATGGIGGVHHQPPFDLSADLTELARTPMIVVCAGAKSILDLPATLEVLETYSVPVIGFRTGTFPAFYAADSGLPLTQTADSAASVVAMAKAHWALGLQSAVLVVVPPPAEVALPFADLEKALGAALAEAKHQGLRGQAVTPFLLERISHHTGGASLQANLGLLRNNARVAASLAVGWDSRDYQA